MHFGHGEPFHQRPFHGPPGFWPPHFGPPPPPEIFRWVPATLDSAEECEDAVVGGHEGWDGSPLWVIRAFYNDDLVPGKLAIKHKSALFAHCGQEHPTEEFEVLCAPPDALQWIEAAEGEVPPGAIIAGNTDVGEPLYIGRVPHMNSMTPGKVHPSHNCCYISFGGNEIAFPQYEVLCSPLIQAR